MIRSGYGVVLRPLTLETAEQVRVWRNTPRIMEQMEYRETISPDMQARWFVSIQNEEYRYYVIYADNIPLGLIHLAKIDRLNHTAEAGLFVGEAHFMGTGVALGASLLLLELAFGDLALQRVWAKVKQGNESAEKYNALLGFSYPEECSPGFNRWILTRENFEARKNVLVALTARK